MAQDPHGKDSKDNSENSKSIGKWLDDQPGSKKFRDYLVSIGYTLKETFEELADSTDSTYFTSSAKESKIVGKVVTSFQSQVNKARIDIKNTQNRNILFSFFLSPSPSPSPSQKFFFLSSFYNLLDIVNGIFYLVVDNMVDQQ